MRFDKKTGQVTLTLAEDVILGGAVVHKAGEVITMAVTPADVTNQTEELDTYLGGYQPFGFAADLVSPIVLVSKEKGTRRDFSKENAFEVVDTRVGRSGAINEVQHLSETASYATEEHALAAFIPWASENDAAMLYNVRAAHGEMLMWKLALAREVRVWTMLTTLANWNSANRTSLSGTTYWDTGSSKNPIKNIHDRISASAQPVTDIFMNPDVAFWFLTDTTVRTYMAQMLGDSAPNPEVARASNAQGLQKFVIPGIPPVTVVSSKRTNASTGVLENILNDSVVFACTPPGAAPRDGSRIATTYTFRTRGRSGTGVTTNEYMPNGRGLNGGTMFETGFGEDSSQMVSSIAGGLITDVLST